MEGGGGLKKRMMERKLECVCEREMERDGVDGEIWREREGNGE